MRILNTLRGRTSRSRQRCASALTIAIAFSTAGGPVFVPAVSAQTQTAPVSAAGTTQAQSPRKPGGALILGELTSIAVRDVNDPASGGQIVVDGKAITIPERLSVGLPSGLVPLRDLMLEAPAECKSQRPPQSGLAASDSCRGDRPPALARVVAGLSASGELVATLLMIQKDSGRTLARIRPQGRARARSYGQQPSDAAAYPKKAETPPK
jgi:hypothetical protein